MGSYEANGGPKGGHKGPSGSHSIAIGSHRVEIGGHRMVLGVLGRHGVAIWGNHYSTWWL
mgnify:FL=1